MHRRRRPHRDRTYISQPEAIVYRQNPHELKARAAAFKERDINPEVYKKSCYARRQIIKQEKHQYRTKIESYYTGSDARRMWQGLQTITDYKGKPNCELPSDTSLPDGLNAFYASNTKACMRALAVPGRMCDPALRSICEQDL